MPQLLNEGRVLIGYMSEPEALSFLRRRCVFEGDREERIREVYSGYAKTAAKPPRLSTSVRVRDFDEKTHAYLTDNVPTDRIRSGALRGLPWSFKEVEIDGLVCAQKYVNLSYVAMISKGCDFSNRKDLVDICLTDRFLNRESIIRRVRETEYQVGADGDDLRVLRLTENYDEKDGSRVVSVRVGWGMASTLVVKVGEKYYLKNGSHRVYALRSNGVKFVPCVLVEGKTYANVGLPGQPGFFGESLVTSDRAPTFAAYFSDKLSGSFSMRPRHTLITVTASVLKTPSDETLAKELELPTTKTKDRAIEDVDIVREGWNVYSLSDGNVLKMRQLVKGVGRLKQRDGRVLAAVSQTPVSLSVIPEALGTPSHRDYGQAELRASIEEENVKFKVVEEPANEYATKGRLHFIMRLKLVKVSRTNKFDRDGLPIYLVKTESRLEQL